jgi:hypothetical protein
VTQFAGGETQRYNNSLRGYSEKTQCTDTEKQVKFAVDAFYRGMGGSAEQQKLANPAATALQNSKKSMQFL